MSDTNDPKKKTSRPAVEPDRPPVMAMTIWILALVLTVALVVVGVIQFFFLTTAREIERKAETDRTDLMAVQALDNDYLVGIEDAMALVAADPAMLGIVSASGDGQGEGETEGVDQIEPSVVLDETAAVPTEPAGVGEAVNAAETAVGEVTEEVATDAAVDAAVNTAETALDETATDAAVDEAVNAVGTGLGVVVPEETPVEPTPEPAQETDEPTAPEDEVTPTEGTGSTSTP